MKHVELITTGLIYISFFASLAFVVGYLVVAPWWRTTIGRQMLAFGVVVLLISTLAVLSQIFGQDYAARPVFRLLTWTGTAGTMIGLCIALYRAQIRKGR